MTTWFVADLKVELQRYHAFCSQVGLAQLTVDSYTRYGGFFVRWLAGEYRPRDAAGPAPGLRTGTLSIADLTQALWSYRDELVDARMQPNAVQTYHLGASQFVRWLDGRFEPGRSLGRKRTALAASEPTRVDDTRPPILNATIAQVEPRPGRGDWLTERQVQSAVVSWLVRDGWSIDRVADTESREHGVDILASRAGESIAVEVKGYPSATYVRGENAGLPKKWHVGSQARTYFGDAVRAALAARDQMVNTQVAIALPDVPTYDGLAKQVIRSLSELGIIVLMIDEGGGVRHFPSAVP